MAVKCFASMNNQCNALDIIGKCDGLKEKCPFYQTPGQVSISRVNALRHLASLPEDEQRYISEKYYGGKKPWQELIMTTNSGD